MDPSAADGIPRLKIRVRQIERLCSNDKSLDRQTKSHLRMVFDKFLELVQVDRALFESSQYKTTKTFSPIELEGICCLLSQWGAQRPTGMLRGDIRLLRDHLRQKHSELRSSDAHWATCWNYIEELEVIRGALDTATVTKPRSLAPRQNTRPQQTPKNSATKRGRNPALSDEDDDDFRPSATAKRAAGSGRRAKLIAPRASTNISSYAINPDLGVLETEQPGVPRSTAPGVHKDLATHSAHQNPRAHEIDQMGLSAGDSSSSSPWDSDDEREQIARRAARGQVAVKAPVASMGGGQFDQTARKRALMDLGGNANAARDLDAKKARVMATRVKQEK